MVGGQYHNYYLSDVSQVLEAPVPENKTFVEPESSMPHSSNNSGLL